MSCIIKLIIKTMKDSIIIGVTPSYYTSVIEQNLNNNVIHNITHVLNQNAWLDTRFVPRFRCDRFTGIWELQNFKTDKYQITIEMLETINEERFDHSENLYYLDGTRGSEIPVVYLHYIYGDESKQKTIDDILRNHTAYGYGFIVTFKNNVLNYTKKILVPPSIFHDVDINDEIRKFVKFDGSSPVTSIFVHSLVSYMNVLDTEHAKILRDDLGKRKYECKDDIHDILTLLGFSKYGNEYLKKIACTNGYINLFISHKPRKQLYVRANKGHYNIVRLGHYEKNMTLREIEHLIKDFSKFVIDDLIVCLRGFEYPDKPSPIKILDKDLFMWKS